MKRRHAAFLTGRHLAIRGASLVANSKLLSRLWHHLRVVPVPAAWLKSLRRLITNSVMPFARTPSWEAVCRSKAFGGLGIIDPEAQQWALQMIYVQRLLHPASEARQKMDFITPLIFDLLTHHTGLNSILPLFVFPKTYAFQTLSLRTSKMPLLHHLLKVLSKLAALPLSSSWHCKWVLDFPLRCVLTDVDPAFVLPTIPMKWLLSDLLHTSSRNPD